MERFAPLTRFVSALLSFALVAGGMVAPGLAQERRPINIRFGQPNIWSLEQAHYLLARMRTRNLGIQGRDLADSDLDPNDVVGARLRQLRQSLGVGVGFDAVAGLNTGLFERESSFKQQRREQLLPQRDQLQLELTDVIQQHNALQLDKERMKLAGAKDPELNFKQVEIDQKAAQKTWLENRITSVNTELTGLSVTATPATANVPTPQATPAGESVLEKLMADKEFRDSLRGNIPELNASTKLDNYLDFQLELIAKQLTLLRDELGPGERLIFLELPQSLYTVPDKSNRKLAQVWWHVDGYYINSQEAAPTPAPPAAAQDKDYRKAFPGLSEECWKEIKSEEAEREAQRTEELRRRKESKAGKKEYDRRKAEALEAMRQKPPRAGATAAEIEQAAYEKVEKEVEREVSAALAEKGDTKAQRRRFQCNPYSGERARTRADILTEINRRQQEQFPRKRAEYIARETAKGFTPREVQPQDFEPENYYFDVNAANVNNGEIRTVDLIPRQSAFNVNDIQDKQKNFNLAGLFTFLSGFGARVDYQRQRRLYEQFITQDTYASAFGKGDSEFGWTFGPKPGTERIATGLHTTYAILVVPERADTIKLTARGCYFPRTGYAPGSFGETNERNLVEGASSMASLYPDVQCTADETFRLPIPGTTENNFWVSGIEYTPVRPGERAVVYVHGDYFSPQVGVLVDGVPLRQTVGLAQVMLAGAPRDNGFQPAPRGDFEFISSKLMALAFTMPRNARGEEYKGTPTIALVTPGRARIINDVRLVINDSYKCKREQAGGAVRADANCPCYEYDNPSAPEKDRTCKVFERYKRLPEPVGLDRKDSIFVELADQPAMFSDLPKPESLEIGELRVLGTTAGGMNNAYLTGSRLDPRDELRINGVKLTVDCKKTVNEKPAPCTPEDLLAAAEGKGEKIERTCAMGADRVECPESLGKNLLRIQFKATKEPVIDVTLVHRQPPKDPQIASKQFRNAQLPRVDKVTIVEYQKRNKPALLKLFIEGSGFSPDLPVTPVAEKKTRFRQKLISATSMALDIELEDQLPVLRLDIGPNAAGQSVPVIVSLPVDPPEPRERESRRERESGRERELGRP